MISAEAKKINHEPFSTGQTRKIRRRCINREQVVRWLMISGVFLSLMTINSIIQALLAQTQMRLNQLQTKIEVIDRELGEIQMELANLRSYERVEGLAFTKFGMRPAGVDSINIALLPTKQGQPKDLKIPLYMVTANNSRENGVHTPGIVGKIGNWVAGLSRTLAGVELNY